MKNYHVKFVTVFHNTKSMEIQADSLDILGDVLVLRREGKIAFASLLKHVQYVEEVQKTESD